MKNNTCNIPIILTTPENNENSNSIIIQLKTRAQQEEYLISIERSNESVLKAIKDKSKIGGIIINIDNSMLMSRKKSVVLAIRKTNLLLPIFLIRKNIVIALSPYERKITQGKVYKCDKKNINWENIILESIAHYVKNSKANIQLLPEEIRVYSSARCVTSSNITEYKKNNTSIENEFIDYFYKEIVEDCHSTSKGNYKNHTLKNTLLLHKTNKQPENNNTYHSEPVDCFTPIRNGLSLSGLIPPEQFELKNILNTLTNNDKQSEKYREICYGIMMASTSDGLIYNIEKIIKKIYDAEIKRQFNEEWVLFNDYHPFFNGVFSNSILSKMRSLPPLYAAKSIHYILSALSSSPPENNKEKPIILLKIIINSIKFRKAIIIVRDKIKIKTKIGWFFNVWQPDKILFNHTPTPFKDIPDEALTLDASFWQLNPLDEWHGFSNITKNYAMLDPTKVTLLCPGQDANGKITDFGIPAMVIVRFLENKLIIPKKSGNYSFLFDISSDSTPEKWQKIIEALLEFKKHHDTNVLLDKIFPTLVKKSPFYTTMGLGDLCEQIHITINSLDIPILFKQALLTKKSWHSSQYHPETTENMRTELVSINNVIMRTIAIAVSSDISISPILIPGERITENNKVIIDYLLALQIFDQTFPGFEHRMQGIWRNTYGEYFIKCLIEV